MFTLTIETGNEAMHTPDDIAAALQEVANKVRSGHGNGNVRDANGNTVGSFAIEPGDDDADAGL